MKIPENLKGKLLIKILFILFIIFALGKIAFYFGLAVGNG